MNYWDKVLTRRIGRRRGLAMMAGGAAAAFLAACGGDDQAGEGDETTEDPELSAHSELSFRSRVAADGGRRAGRNPALLESLALR